MKAVLEFSYPEDEQKLLFALNGGKMYKALTDIAFLLRTGHTFKSDAELLERIGLVVDEALKEVHK
jgi:hypothetical protein